MKIARSARAWLAATLLAGCARPPAGTETVVTEGPLEVWTAYEGKLDARRMLPVASDIGGSTKITELIAEGAVVAPGDVLARFDASALDRDLLKAETDYELARLDLDQLARAKLPLERAALDMKLAECRALYDHEADFLRETEELAREDLVAAREVDQQSNRVEQARRQLAAQEQIVTLTRDCLHPAQLERARRQARAAAGQRNLLREQVRAAAIRAPGAGVVVFKPLHLEGEFRAVRVGDTVFYKQPFLFVAAMTDLVVDCYVPESELPRVAENSAVRVQPLAFPDLQLPARVEQIGSMAQDLQGRADWQKYFHVRIALLAADNRLRSGMSVHAQVLSYATTHAVRVPRRAVWWENGAPCCRVRRGRGAEVRALELGFGDDRDFEVRSGLQPGDRVLLR